MRTMLRTGTEGPVLPKPASWTAGGRFSSILPLTLIFLGIAFLTRTVLVVKVLPSLPLTVGLLLRIYGVGLLFDLAFLTYFWAGASLLMALPPDRLWRSLPGRVIRSVALFGTIYLFAFSAIAEYIFFDEYGTRFNFIAVDYLIYTSEVLRNIWESYPVPSLLAGIGILAVPLFLVARRMSTRRSAVTTSISGRVLVSMLLAAVCLPVLLFVDVHREQISSNAFANELAADGPYNLFAAFRNNEIDYQEYYPTLGSREMHERLRHLIGTDNGPADDGVDSFLARRIEDPLPEQRLNVVTIIVESLSAEFLGSFGNGKGLTPRLDALARDGLLFTNLYATGTRTDRGLEAITLSVPPTPGRSIVKRPGNEDMFSWGAVMRSKGYDTMFLYGGYGYFDNMNYFFGHNGYRTIDRSNIADRDVHFSNAWGVCDEDLFDQAIREFNASHAAKHPFFAEIMTTSNHRPYTYPDGRIDIPSHTGRSGAVKYTDYAIGKFIEDAKKEPWFRDTVFVIVADHCASSAGRTELPVKRYEIPLIIYSPGYVQPGRVDRLASQIDIAPTVLGLLHFTYESRFFGKDILQMQHKQGRAFIGTYQKLGYLTDDSLVVLAPRQKASCYRVDRATGEIHAEAAKPELIDAAISYYQGESERYRQRAVKR